MLKAELDLVLFTVTRKSYYDAIDTKNSIFAKIGVGSFYRINVHIGAAVEMIGTIFTFVTLK